MIRDRRFWAQDGEEGALAARSPEAAVDDEQPDAGVAGGAAGASSVPEIERLRTAFAEVEETKHRLEREAGREVQLLRQKVLESLIPVLDNLERCIGAAESSQNAAALLQGVQLVQGQFLRTLAQFGLERVSTVGNRFDPRIHDAVALVPVTEPAHDGLVIGEIEPAYCIGDRVVRPAKVQVGRAASRPPT
ncbi:MAG: nucleotide exchange factor GrpE [Pseudomonadota bacterium]